MSVDEAAITKLVQETHDHCAAYLRQVGIMSGRMCDLLVEPQAVH